MPNKKPLLQDITSNIIWTALIWCYSIQEMYSNIDTYSRTSSFRSQSSFESVLNDKNFAPPPKRPSSIEVTKSRIFGHEKEAQSTLPAFHEIKHSGKLSARFSLKSILIKKWRSTFWITYGNSRILFFRSKEDFDEWAVNPYLSKQDRDKLVKLAVDFVNDAYKPGFKMKGYKVSAMKTKSTNQGNVNYFHLERWHSYAPTVVAIFGSRKMKSLDDLYQICSEMIRKSGNGFSQDLQNGHLRSESDAGSSIYDAEDRGIRMAYSDLSFSNMSFDSAQPEPMEQRSTHPGPIPQRSLQLGPVQQYPSQPEPIIDQRDDMSNQENSRGRQRNILNSSLFRTFRSRSSSPLSRDGNKSWKNPLRSRSSSRRSRDADGWRDSLNTSDPLVPASIDKEVEQERKQRYLPPLPTLPRSISIKDRPPRVPNSYHQREF